MNMEHTQLVMVMASKRSPFLGAQVLKTCRAPDGFVSVGCLLVVGWLVVCLKLFHFDTNVPQMLTPSLQGLVPLIKVVEDP